MSDDFPEPLCMEYGAKIKFDRYLYGRSMCAPSLQRELGIYGEYMSYEVRDRV